MQRFAAWSVHALTASGIVVGLLALFAVLHNEPRIALLWLALALFIDGIDGPLARRVKVAEMLPDFDGNILDLVIDYFTYVIVPALLIDRAGLVPADWGGLAMAAILVSSLYHYARRDIKTRDHYFNGFPAFWNLVALYLWAWQLDPVAGHVIVLSLAGLTITPVKFIHPFRVRAWRSLPPVAATVWAVSSVGLLLTGGAAFGICEAVSAASAFLLFSLGVFRTIRGPARQEVDHGGHRGAAAGHPAGS